MPVRARVPIREQPLSSGHFFFPRQSMPTPLLPRWGRGSGAGTVGRLGSSVYACDFQGEEEVFMRSVWQWWVEQVKPAFLAVFQGSKQEQQAGQPSAGQDLQELGSIFGPATILYLCKTACYFFIQVAFLASRLHPKSTVA